ncbi:hypothetical protein STENM327S_07779 [Streptomyces tendae]
MGRPHGTLAERDRTGDSRADFSDRSTLIEELRDPQAPLDASDADAKVRAAELIGRLGFDTADVGTLDESWRFEPGACPRIYLADPDVPAERIMQALRGTAAHRQAASGVCCSPADVRVRDTPRGVT